MRGKASSSISSFMTTGITPAYAGKSTRTATASVLRRDHPRLCGEKKNQHWFLTNATGSPPPMRGKVSECVQLLFRCGITPAYAGKRLLFSRAELAAEDHPRLCGEKPRLKNECTAKKGSPPPMRGKGDWKQWAKAAGRITPAYAGKRYRPPAKVQQFWDHPRLCGEKHLNGILYPLR